MKKTISLGLIIVLGSVLGGWLLHVLGVTFPSVLATIAAVMYFVLLGGIVALVMES